MGAGFRTPTSVESRGQGPARLALDRGDGGDHGAAGHDRAVHLHLLGGGGGGGLPGPHLAGLQIRELGGKGGRMSLSESPDRHNRDYITIADTFIRARNNSVTQ